MAKALYHNLKSRNIRVLDVTKSKDEKGKEVKSKTVRTFGPDEIRELTTTESLSDAVKAGVLEIVTKTQATKIEKAKETAETAETAK